MRPLAYSFKSDSEDDRNDESLPTIGSYHELGDDSNNNPAGPRRAVAQARTLSPRSSGSSRRDSRLSQIGADRPIFTLSVAADLLGLHPRTLRIYEEKKLVVPARTEGNRRRYSQNDIQRFQFIRYLTRAGVNLEGVRIILDMAQELIALGGDPETIIEQNVRDSDDE